jgi:hypothetical protein
VLEADSPHAAKFSISAMNEAKCSGTAGGDAHMATHCDAIFDADGVRLQRACTRSMTAAVTAANHHQIAEQDNHVIQIGQHREVRSCSRGSLAKLEVVGARRREFH